MASAFNNMFDDSATRSVTLVKQIRDDGFLLSTGVRLFGPVILLNGDVFLWDVPQNSKLSDEWNVDFMKIFDVIVPKPELLIIGTGKSIVPIAPKIRQYIHKLGMQIEILDTKNASSTFNVLTEEGRRVAAALLPLNPTSARTGKAL
ncbi:6839_t:CDS:2 [Paraglomus brasilianum]|uniref:NADH dehydrogenase [ubiquinone] 1 alpha subcomplex assembly factor 3 n=1 Tax=Paraglomus brasilianum TaxID=144538 RepID=A0A9N9G494_9GLOM|nr:6839_t:CDS:2 [Paraglomus brasilianum]